ncbi:MAG: ATP-dependent protease LonB [Nanoarchaeota archaeon]|nr:ATP-dependent protease LonB [Nanoarchaeota archaeon]
MNFKNTSEIKVPSRLIDRIIGQDNVIDIIKKASKQRRHILLIGQPGTGKSMCGLGLSESLPNEKLVDILSLDNPSDDNNPIIKTVPKGEGKRILQKAKLQSMSSIKNQNIIFFVLLIIAMVTPWWIRSQYGDIMAAASLIGSMIFLASYVLFMNLSRKSSLIGQQIKIPKLLVDNSQNNKVPFIDASGAQVDALLGTILHDPLQSGGLGTPAYERVIPGFVHKANGGVLFIDEIGNLPPLAQQELLTAIQEKKFPITCKTERSSGASVVTSPAPTDFVLVAAGTPEAISNMHPALRSRIRGYGYEVYMNNDIDDNEENKTKIIKFIAQEVENDKKIPHFTKEATLVIIQEAKKRAGRAGKLTLRLRELGGLVRAAGDLALDEGAKFVTPTHIERAKLSAKTLEQQIADKYIEQKKTYQVILTKGKQIGRVNGLAVLGTDNYFSGIVLPIESEVTPSGQKAEFITTGQLGKIAKEAVKNVSAIVLKYFGEDIKEKYDIYTQFIGTPEGVEGDSASIAVATAIISAFTKVPIKQNYALTGSLSVRGEVLAIGGVTAKVEAAIEAGISHVIVPKANERDIMLPLKSKNKIKIIPVSTIQEVLKHALDWKGKERILKKIS